MINQIVLVGRLVFEPELRTTESGRSLSRIRLAVDRSFKNSEGMYETDFIDCLLWKGIAETTTEYCTKGDLIGVKGRLQMRSYEKDGEKRYASEVVAEKVTFLDFKGKDQELPV
jgi:single-strand DNA-binding protein